MSEDYIDMVIRRYQQNGIGDISAEFAREQLAALRARADELEQDLNVAVDILRALNGYGVALPDEAHELIVAPLLTKQRSKHE